MKFGIVTFPGSNCDYDTMRGVVDDPTLAAQAERLLSDASPLVRGAAVWALGRLAPRRLAALAAQRAQDDADVEAEWTAALAA